MQQFDVKVQPLFVRITAKQLPEQVVDEFFIEKLTIDFLQLGRVTKASTIADRPAPNRFKLLKNRESASVIPMRPLNKSRP